MATRITATEVARNLSDVLNRVRYRGESFVVERAGEVVAQIVAPKPETSVTGQTLIEKIRSLPPVDKGFADDVQKAIDSQPVEVPRDPWAS